MEINPLLQSLFERVEGERLIVRDGDVGVLHVDTDAIRYMEPDRGRYGDFLDAILGERESYQPPQERLKVWARSKGINVHESPAQSQVSLTFTAPDNHFFVPSYEGSVVTAFRQARQDAISSGALKREPNRLFVAPETWRALNSADEYRYYQMMGAAYTAPSMRGEDLVFEGMTIKPLAAKGRAFAVAYVTQKSVTLQR